MSERDAVRAATAGNAAPSPRARDAARIRPGAADDRDATSIRPERPGDRDAVFAVQRAAFGRDDEARLVDRLRDAGAARVSLVAERGGEVVGHVLFSPVRVRGDGGEREAAGLAPVAVLPECQRTGIGDALVRAGLEACRAAGHDLVFVLGHPSYYPRFGFDRADARGLAWEHPGHEAAFFVRELAPGAWPGGRGIVSYHPEFEKV